MIKRCLILFLLNGVALVLAACNTQYVQTVAPEIIDTPEFPTPTPQPSIESTVLISEVLAGVDGNNNHDFIELANPGRVSPFDLKGWSLWFKLSENDKEMQVFRWTEHALIPPQGHYLLFSAGQEVDEADAFFEIGMIPQRGGLQLRRPDRTIADSLAWGDGPLDFAEGQRAAAMKNGIALERMPGGNLGNWLDTNDNLSDFASSTPSPQYTASPASPVRESGLALTIKAPPSVLPGEQFSYILSVTNHGSQAINGITVQLPIPKVLEVVDIPADMTVSSQDAFWGMAEIGMSSHVILWDCGNLEANGSVSTQFTVSAPWTYIDLVVANYSAQGSGEMPAAFGGQVHTIVEGGSVPVGVISELVGQELVVEGIATMFTGGYYAGGGNVKFYLADESGGVQVWVPGGEGNVNVRIGDHVRVKGKLEVYRGALEIVVNDLSDVEVLASKEEAPPWVLTAASIEQAANDPSLAGKLVQVTGTVIRNDEFSYSYELDLIDEGGQLITLYVDKLTNISVEVIEIGQEYRVAGILEIYDTRQQLYPRIQADLERVYPAVLTLEMRAPNTVISGDDLAVTLTATNYLQNDLFGLTITATLPASGVDFVSASQGADIRGNQIVWSIPELASGGTAVQVSYTVKAIAEVGYLTFDHYSAIAHDWLEPIDGDPYFVFLGDSVPVWAIQGAGDRSPYTFDRVVTVGTVTGVFPDLGGFWIQETESDNDPLTSAGLFINTNGMDVSVNPGSTVQVSGVVRETYQQTQVEISGPEDVVVLKLGGTLPTAISLTPPPNETESNAYYESLEGMLVQVDGGWIAVGPTSQYGEYVLVSPEHGIDRLWQGDHERNGLGIMVDDGRSFVHADRSSLSYVVNSGDRVSGLIGPLAYTFGQYKIEPVVQPQVDPVDITLPELSPSSTVAFSLMTWNVENLFDIFDPHPSDPQKPTMGDYKVWITKVANTILAAGAPTIIGLQEVENIGILEDIAAHEILEGYQYQPILIEGTDSRYIDNGYLVRGDIAQVIEVIQQVAPEGLTSRPPLQIEVEIQTPTNPVRVFVINNHFTSMSGGEEATEPRRDAQAAWNVMVLERILEADPDALVAIIGDLNSYTSSKPLDTLRGAGLVHVYELDPQAGWYSYIYEGVSQTLDHILVTPNLFDLLQRVDILHVNADFGPPIAADESPLRKSDHDPVIATFVLP